jgi:NAD(P)-dependent dehydrogenase (short-subunit alcohol dehydrogenase family)
VVPLREKEAIMKKNFHSLFDLTGKTAVVTGAGSGLGRAIAEAVAEAGARVACVDINVETAKETSAKIRKLKVDSIYIECDVSKEKEVKKAFESIETKLGRVDILFNNAGISGPNLNVLQVSLKEWNRVIGINLTGIFLCAKESVRIMLKQKSGKIINTASIWSFRGGFPLLMVPPYHAAKGALISLTKEMALEYAKDGITVNAIAPGFFATNLSTRLRDEKFRSALASSIPLGRVGMPEDMKGTALFLASAASDYLTGSVIVVDGGYMCK